MSARRTGPPAMTADDFQSIMDATDLTLKEAGAVLGLSLPAVNRLIRGKVSISADAAAIIRDRLQGAKPEWSGAGR